MARRGITAPRLRRSRRLPVTGALRPQEPGGLRRRLRLSAAWVQAGLLAVLLAAAVGAAGTFLYRSDLLRVRTVTVEGAVALDPAEVAARADLLGHSVITLDTDDAERRLRAAYPDLRGVAVARDWPRGAVVRLQERTPWAIWYSGDSRYVIDEEGVVLSRGEPPPGAVTVRQLDGRTDLRPGDRVDADALHLAQRVLGAAPQGVRVAEFRYHADQGLLAVTEDNVEVRLGDGVDLEYKLAVWAALLEAAADAGRRVSLIDLRFGDRPYFR
ncbi:MAG TPA: cell division protein FtsQ/DivIB [Dehalococcoidia bacterium]